MLREYLFYAKYVLLEQALEKEVRSIFRMLLNEPRQPDERQNRTILPEGVVHKKPTMAYRYR